MLSWGKEHACVRACGLPCELQAGSGLVMAPLTFPRCRLWLAWFPVGSVCFLGFSSRDLLHIPPHPTLCLPALNPCESEFPCKDSEQRIPDPGLTFFVFPSASWKTACLIFISPSLSSVRFCVGQAPGVREGIRKPCSTPDSLEKKKHSSSEGPLLPQSQCPKVFIVLESIGEMLFLCR